MQNQKWDDYFNSYMEETQKQVNEHLTLDEFSKLQFHQGEIPDFMIDFIDYLTGTKGFFIRCLTENLSQMSRNSRQHQSDFSNDLSMSGLNNPGAANINT